VRRSGRAADVATARANAGALADAAAEARIADKASVELARRLQLEEEDAMADIAAGEAGRELDGIQAAIAAGALLDSIPSLGCHEPGSLQALSLAAFGFACARGSASVPPHSAP
jgi:hypothetical protein